jgi:cytoskeletal protein CcmA (bactofilin family)/chromosome segregation ATPase
VTSDGDSGLFKALFRRGSRTLELTGYHAGDIDESRAVRVAPGAAAAGNIRAPEVLVEGLLVGSVLAEVVRVAPGGQIAGDVYAASITVEGGGQISGWVHTVSADECSSMRSNLDAATPAAVITDGEESGSQLLPVALRQEWVAERGRPDWLALLQLFRAELSTALLARQELEQAFERRIDEVAGETRARLHEVEADLADSVALRRELAGKLDSLEQDYDHQRQELEGVRSLLQQRVVALRAAERALAEAEARTLQLQQENDAFQQELSSTFPPVEQLSARVENLEAALQASVQRSAEQEEAQLRWQELADVSQQRIKELEEQLAPAQKQVEQLRRLNGDLVEKLNWLEQEREELERELDRLRIEEATRFIPDSERQGLADVQARNERLEAQLEAARLEMATLEEQLLWRRLSEAAVMARLDAGSGAQAEYEAQLRTQLEQAALHLETEREVAEKWKAQVGRLTELLYEADREAKRYAAELAALRAQRRAAGPESADEPALAQRLREVKAENDALENEVTRLHRDIASQRERLAEAQAAMAEVRVNLQEQMTAARAELEHLRGAASRRIHELQAELAERDKQMQALQGRPERRRPS